MSIKVHFYICMYKKHNYSYTNKTQRKKELSLILMMKKYFPDNVHVQTRIHNNYNQTALHEYFNSPVVHLVRTIRIHHNISKCL
jgi:hypothetical protein